MSKTLSERQYKGLITKSKVGWAHFYQSEKRNHELHMEYMLRIKELNDSMEGRDEDHIPDFVKNEITSLIAELKKQVECPICLDELKSDQIKFSSCGHKYCETCLSKINECAICRKKIYHKK